VSIPLQFQAKQVDPFDKMSGVSSVGDIPSVVSQIKRYDLLKQIQSQLSQIKQFKELDITKEPTMNGTPNAPTVGSKRRGSDIDSLTCNDEDIR